jgi:hypothetical protein
MAGLGPAIHDAWLTNRRLLFVDARPKAEHDEP